MPTNARVILDSIGPNGARITTFELTYHRYVHAELMTHRLLSRNSASSRAIPNAKLMQRVLEDPAIPVVWGTNQAGMQAAAPLEGEDAQLVEGHWLAARTTAMHYSKLLSDPKNGYNIHKQIANRLIEPWMFITVLVTATELDNFFALRVHPKAQPEIEKVARLALEAYNSSTPQRLDAGQWHLPLVTGYDEAELRGEPHADDAYLCRISTGRCARVSYLTHEGKREPAKDVGLGDDLRSNGHMSPFEHVAQAMTSEEWKKYAEHLACEWINHRIPVGNFWGWRQYRKTLENEHNFSLLQNA
jgi:thymidylate synthase ThyX